MSYGTDFADLFRLAASYVDRILRGDKPADLPVQLPVKYQTVLNLKTAKALGLTIPPSLRLQADEVIASMRTVVRVKGYRIAALVPPRRKTGV